MNDHILLLVFIALCALQAADMLTTILVLEKNGAERNPIVRWLIDKLGRVPGLATAKATGVIAGAVLVAHGQIEWLALTAALYLVVVINNLRVLRQL
jgi:hypothetical protein